MLGVGAALLPGVRIAETTGDGLRESIMTAVGFMWIIAVFRFLGLWVVSHAEPSADVARLRKQLKGTSATESRHVSHRRDAA